MKYVNLPVLFATAFFITVTQSFTSVSFGSELSSTGKVAFYDELSIGTGYGWGLLEREGASLSVVPLHIRFGFAFDSLTGCEDLGNTLQLTIEPFLNPVIGDKKGIETGMAFGIRYTKEIVQPLGFYVEASIAPMYYSIDTVEQGKEGFNFLNQFGGGLSYRISDRIAVYSGYRFRHLSHAGLCDRSNNGINTNVLVLGLSLFQ